MGLLWGVTKGNFGRFKVTLGNLSKTDRENIATLGNFKWHKVTLGDLRWF